MNDNYEPKYMVFAKNNLSFIPKIADKCINYNLNNNNQMHFTPYYYCKLCKIQFCCSCAYFHLLSNIKDQKHKYNNIIPSESINPRFINQIDESPEPNPLSVELINNNNYDSMSEKMEKMNDGNNNNSNIFNETTKIKEDILSYINTEILEIESEKKKLFEIKNLMNEKLDFLDYYYNNILEKVKYLQKNKIQIVEIIKGDDNNTTKLLLNEEYGKIKDYFYEIKKEKYDKICLAFNEITSLINEFTKSNLNTSDISINELNKNNKYKTYESNINNNVFKNNFSLLNLQNKNNINYNVETKEDENTDNSTDKFVSLDNDSSININDNSSIIELNEENNIDNKSILSYKNSKTNRNEINIYGATRKQKQIKKRMCIYCGRMVRLQYITKHLISHHFELAPNHLKYKVYAKKIIDNIEKIKYMVNEIHEIQMKIKVIDIEEQYQKNLWFLKYQTLLKEYNELINQKDNKHTHNIKDIIIPNV